MSNWVKDYMKLMNTLLNLAYTLKWLSRISAWEGGWGILRTLTAVTTVGRRKTIVITREIRVRNLCDY